METSLSINIARLFSALIKGYQQLLSPLLGPHCRFYPSCSDYARQALGVYGLYKGAWLASKRLLRCHPLTVGGDDPLPPKTSLHHLNVE